MKDNNFVIKWYKFWVIMMFILIIGFIFGLLCAGMVLSSKDSEDSPFIIKQGSNLTELQFQQQLINHLIDGIKTADVNLKIDQYGNQYGEITIYYER